MAIPTFFFFFLLTVEEEEVSFRFDEGRKETHRLPWTEILRITDAPFESLEDIQVGMDVLAPYYDDNENRIRHAEATVISSTEVNGWFDC